MSSATNKLWVGDPEVAANYRCFERITRPIGELLIKQSGILSTKETPLIVLDNACGTGVITTALNDKLDDDKKATMQLTCGDITSGMIEYMKHMINSKKLTGRAQLCDAQNTGLPSNHYTHVLTNFGWQAMPKSLPAINECFRILRPNGVFGCTTWEYLGHLELMQKATATIPGAPPFPSQAALMSEMSDGAWGNRTWVEETLENHGFENVKIDVKLIDMEWSNVQELKDSIFPKMMSMAPAKIWSKDDYDKFGPLLAPALEKHLLGKYWKESPFQFEMVAIIATAKKPSL